MARRGGLLVELDGLGALAAAPPAVLAAGAGAVGGVGVAVLSGENVKSPTTWEGSMPSCESDGGKLVLLSRLTLRFSGERVRRFLIVIFLPG